MQDQLRKLIAENSAQLAAINKSQAVLEISLEGTILSANENFQRVVGYSADELKGRDQTLLVDSNVKNSDDYRRGWDKLRRGEADQGRYAAPRQGQQAAVARWQLQPDRRRRWQAVQDRDVCDGRDRAGRPHPCDGTRP